MGALADGAFRAHAGHLTKNPASLSAVRRYEPQPHEWTGHSPDGQGIRVRMNAWRSDDIKHLRRDGSAAPRRIGMIDVDQTALGRADQNDTELFQTKQPDLTGGLE